jgi:glycolate oxidase FAD binding subunit
MPDPKLILEHCLETVRSTRTPLSIVGAGSKSFYGRESQGEPLSMAAYEGIVNYEPTELVVTARAGTKITELTAALAMSGQMLAFEPPDFSGQATLGGTLACGFSGPRRPYSGSARDFVLGVTCLNGKGEVLRFGGQVMKNVAGFDVSRLLVGALGTLGIILEASLKVLPRPEQELTLQWEMPEDQAITAMNSWAGQPLPVSAACYFDGSLYVRLSGTIPAIRAGRTLMGGDEVCDSQGFWRDLREQSLLFFTKAHTLWRIAVPPATPPLPLQGQWLIDWGGAQRWLMSELPATTIRQTVTEQGGYATLYRGGDRQGEVFAPLSPEIALIHKRLKQAFDPKGIFNPGRMYPWL